MKQIRTLLLTMFTMLMLVGCMTRETGEPKLDDTIDATSQITDEESDIGESPSDTFTIAELVEFDGQDGRPAYVAVDGIVYDVTDNEAWAGGEHAGELMAGGDYTEEIMDSPHGESVLEDLPIVGTLIDAEIEQDE